MKTIIEQTRVTPVRENTDVLVIGGGFAGISAALCAARQGASVYLLEKEWLLGGLGTLGLVTIFLPLCDGCGHQAIAGVGEELLRLAADNCLEKGDYPIPDAWLHGGTLAQKTAIRYRVQYNPWHYALLAEQLLLDAGVHLCYGTLATDVIVTEGNITHIIAQDKTGRFALSAKCVVDCTGDNDIARLCHAPTAPYTPGNILAAWHYADTKDGRKLKMLGVAEVPDDCKKGNEQPPLIARRFSGLDGKELTDAVLSSHQATLSALEKSRMIDPGYTISSLPIIPQMRMTSRLLGLDTVSQKNTRSETSIGLTGDWRKAGPVYEIPFGALQTSAVQNLLSAGRGISVTEKVWDVTRVIPTCTVTGQAAGTAAALYAHTGRFNIEEIQFSLKKQHVLLHLEDIL